MQYAYRSDDRHIYTQTALYESLTAEPTEVLNDRDTSALRDVANNNIIKRIEHEMLFSPRENVAASSSRCGRQQYDVSPSENFQAPQVGREYRVPVAAVETHARPAAGYEREERARTHKCIK